MHGEKNDLKTTSEWLQAEEARPAPFGRDAALLAGFAVAYYALAVYATALPFQAGSGTFVWPAEGLALGMLLVARRTLWVPLAGLAFIASLVVGLQGNIEMPVAITRAKAPARR